MLWVCIFEASCDYGRGCGRVDEHQQLARGAAVKSAWDKRLRGACRCGCRFCVVRRGVCACRRVVGSCEQRLTTTTTGFVTIQHAMQLDHGEVLAEDPSTVKKEHEKRRGEREEKKIRCLPTLSHRDAKP